MADLPTALTRIVRDHLRRLVAVAGCTPDTTAWSVEIPALLNHADASDAEIAELKAALVRERFDRKMETEARRAVDVQTAALYVRVGELQNHRDACLAAHGAPALATSWRKGAEAMRGAARAAALDGGCSCSTADCAHDETGRVIAHRIETLEVPHA